MDTLLVVIGIAVAILFGVFAIVQARRVKPSLYLRAETQSLTTSGPVLHRGLAISWEGTPLANPYTVTVTVQNVGGRDLKSDDFDQNRPIVLHLKDASLVTTLSDAASMKAHITVTGVQGKGTDIAFGPDLLKRKEKGVQAVYLLDGKPNHTWEHHLADVKVQEGKDLLDHESPRGFDVVMKMLTGFLLALFLFTILSIVAYRVQQGGF